MASPMLHLLVSVLAAATPPPDAGIRTAPPAAKGRWCTGRYADDFSLVSRAAADLSTNSADGPYTMCVRSTAVYECLSYGPDGNVRRSRKTATAHGTGFGFKRQAGETIMVTNFHVTEYAPVTDDENRVSGVPPGCKRVSDGLFIVDNERDVFAGDDIPLSRLVADPSLDISLVKARGNLPVLPWKIGRSSALKERNVVEVRGFPLGQFRATVQGRVTSAFDHDDYRDWNHDDFVIDAPLSQGNSGSPVLAVNCETGEYELVGVFHADYSRGNSLNVVVHIDEVRELLTTFKRSPPREGEDAFTASTRRRLVGELKGSGRLFFPFGPAPAEVTVRLDGALVYSVFPREFPARWWPLLVVEDLAPPSDDAFGRLGRVWFGNARGLKQHPEEDLEEAERVALDKTLVGLRRGALMALKSRALATRAATSREAAEELPRLERDTRRVFTVNRDLASVLLDAADRLAPGREDEAVAQLDPYTPTLPVVPEAPGAESPVVTPAP